MNDTTNIEPLPAGGSPLDGGVGWQEPERDIVGYVARWGGNCRDCADENGVCPNSGLPCGGARKAIEHVINALQYGVLHGYVSNPLTERTETDEACRFALWWSHKRKTFTTARQAAWAAWASARSKTPND